MDLIVSRITWLPTPPLAARLLRLFTQQQSSSSSRPVVDLPYDVIADILSRLPAELVFQCCHQSSILRALTSSQSFIDMQLNRATSVIVSSPAYHGIKSPPLYFIDHRTNKIAQKSMPISFNSHFPLVLFDSYNGLLLFQNASVFIVWNPVTQEEVTLNKPPESTARGFFFSPKTREYKVIYVHQVGLSFQYITCSLGSRSTRNTTTNNSHSPWHKPAVIVNGALHWMVDVTHTCISLDHSESILAFDIDSENVRTMAPPPAHGYNWRVYNIFLHLFEMGGHLCYGDSSSYPNIIICVLEDYAEQVWIKKHIISLEFLGQPRDLASWLSTMKMDSDELLLRYGEYIFRYNLKLQTSKIFKMPTQNLITFLIHRNSHVSLHKHCVISKPRIQLY